MERSSRPADGGGRRKRDHLAVGKSGEDLAASWYEAHGYEVVARNWRCRQGELDIVARRARLVVFCEVKARTSDAFGLPAEAVGPGKQAKLRRLAALWFANGARENAIRAHENAVGARRERKRPRAWRPRALRRGQRHGWRSGSHRRRLLEGRPSPAAVASALIPRFSPVRIIQHEVCQCRRRSGASRGTDSNVSGPDGNFLLAAGAQVGLAGLRRVDAPDIKPEGFARGG